MYTCTLIGKVYTVYVSMEVHRNVVRAFCVDKMREFVASSYGRGEVIVRDHAGHAVAVCGLNYNDMDSCDKEREVSERVFKSCVEVRGLLPERRKEYVDWWAEILIAHFRKPNKTGDVPSIPLTEPNRAELIKLGFVKPK